MCCSCRIVKLVTLWPLTAAAAAERGETGKQEECYTWHAHGERCCCSRGSLLAPAPTYAQLPQQKQQTLAHRPACPSVLTGTHRQNKAVGPGLTIVDVWGQAGGAGPVGLHSVMPKSLQTLQHKSLQNLMCALATRRPLQQAQAEKVSVRQLLQWAPAVNLASGGSVAPACGCTRITGCINRLH